MNRDTVAHALMQKIRISMALIRKLFSTGTHYVQPMVRNLQKLFLSVCARYEKYEDASPPKLSIKEQMFFAKRLSFLINAGVPILESLQMLGEQASSRRYARVLTSITNDVAGGYSLARAFSRFPTVFGDFGINIVKIGESSGTLATNLNYLADELKKNHSLKQKVASAFVYPIVISIATLAITGFLVLYLFPKIMPIFSSLHMNLPFSTRMVIGLSSFLVHWGILTMVLLITAWILFFIVHRRNERLRHRCDGLALKVPIIGDMIRSYNLANATRTLGLLLRSGVTLAEAIPLTADTTKNLVYKHEYTLVVDRVIRGERISEHLFLNPTLFPIMMTQMIAVGERSGNLSDTLIYLSDMYETEVEEFTKNLSSLIEPALMIVMGLIIGFIAVSIITPIYGITQNLHP